MLIMLAGAVFAAGIASVALGGVGLHGWLVRTGMSPWLASGVVWGVVFVMVALVLAWSLARERANRSRLTAALADQAATDWSNAWLSAQRRDSAPHAGTLLGLLTMRLAQQGRFMTVRFWRTEPAPPAPLHTPFEPLRLRDSDQAIQELALAEAMSSASAGGALRAADGLGADAILAESGRDAAAAESPASTATSPAVTAPSPSSTAPSAAVVVPRPARTWWPRLSTGALWLVVTVLLGWSLSEALVKGRPTLAPLLFLLVAVLLVVGMEGGILRHRQVFIVPGGLLLRTATWRERAWRLHLFVRESSVLLITPTEPGLYACVVSDGAAQHAWRASELEVHVLQRAWRCPLSPPEMERMADLR